MIAGPSEMNAAVKRATTDLPPATSETNTPPTINV